jgi:PAS domain S-box-containing protein
MSKMQATTEGSRTTPDLTPPPASGPSDQNERFRLAWEMASDAMVLSDPEGIVLAANPAYLQLYGYPAEQIIGQSFAIIFPAEVRAWATEQYKEYFAAEAVPPIVESAIERADGARRTVETTVAFITEGGQRTAMLSIIRDITERKRTEELARSKEALEAEIGAQREVEQQMERSREEERARLARELHDGLGGMLTGLKLDLAQLRRRVTGEGPDWDGRMASMLSLVDETINTMRRIATDLRPAVLDDMGLVQALEWQVDEFRRRSGLTCRLVSNVEAVEIDQERSIAVFRIFQETLTNILRHAAATRVEVRLEQRDQTLRIVVKDNGQGIAPERRANGTTLGLASMRERTRLLGGTLEIHSVVGQGTTVRVEIPTQP